MSELIDIDPKEIYTHLANGKKYFPFLPRREDVTIEVVAHHIANIGRWNGATVHPDDPDRIFYSVAEHSVYVAWWLMEEFRDPRLAMQGLLHDASEAFTGDIIRPLKYSKIFHDLFKEFEEPNERCVADALGISYPLDPRVKMGDRAVCAAEWQQIIPKDRGLDFGVKFHDQSVVADRKIKMLNPAPARDLFLTTHKFFAALLHYIDRSHSVG
jgi:hypothetical protein